MSIPRTTNRTRTPTPRLNIPLLEGAWRTAVQDAAREAELHYEPVLLEMMIDGSDLIAALSELGAELHYDETGLYWRMLNAQEDRPVPIEGLEDLGAGPRDLFGVFSFTLDGERWLAGRVLCEGGIHKYRAAILGGPSLRTTVEMCGRIRAAEAKLSDQRLQIYGTRADDSSIADVPEDDLILAPELKRDLLALVDGFRDAAERTAATGSADATVAKDDASRGIMLLGRPGTGKTLAIRHILSRLSGLRRYLYVAGVLSEIRNYGKGFQSLLEDLSRQARPSVVVVEDLDRLFDSGTVTPQHFLNVLDGLLRPGAPTLWIATCNDPAELPDNLTDRPGRFDRLFVFPDPGTPERVEMLRRYAPATLPNDALRRLAAEADGLTGAHLREACRSAGLGVDQGGRELAELLGEQIVGLQRQQKAATQYGRMLREKVGF